MTLPVACNAQPLYVKRLRVVVVMRVEMSTRHDGVTLRARLRLYQFSVAHCVFHQPSHLGDERSLCTLPVPTHLLPVTLADSLDADTLV